MPPTYGGYTPTPANANLDTLPQLSGLMNPLLVAMLPSENRVVPSLTSYLSNNAHYNPRDFSLVDIGNDANDAGAAILAAETNAASLAGIRRTRGTYRHTQSRAYTRIHSFEIGAVDKPFAGVTITYGGLIEAGERKIFDGSLGGSLVFLKQRTFYAAWFGVLGDSATDDAPAWAFMLACMPMNATIILSSGMRMLVNSTVTPTAFNGLTITGPINPLPNPGTQPGFIWGGAVGGDIFKFRSCGYSTIENVFIQLDGGPAMANRGVILDETGINGITGTLCTVRNVKVYCSVPNANGVGIDINPSANASNQEYHEIERCLIFLGGSRDNVQVSTTAASATVTGGGLGNQHAGKRIRVPGAAGGTTALDTVLDSIVANVSGQLHVAATATVTNVQATVGQPAGVGVHIGGNPNAKKINLRYCQLVDLAYGIKQENGSHNRYNVSFTGCEINVYIGNATEPCIGEIDNTEASGQHVVCDLNMHEQCIIRDGRLGTSNITPGQGFLQMKGPTPAMLIVENTQFDDPPGIGSFFYDMAGSSADLHCRNNRYGFGAPTMAQCNYLSGTGVVTVEHDRPIADPPGGASTFTISRSAGGFYYRVSDSSSRTAITGYAETLGGTPTMVGLKGQADGAAGVSPTGLLVGVQGEVCTVNGSVNGATAYSFRAVSPNWNNGGAASEVDSYTILPAVQQSGGHLNVQYGYRCPTLGVPGVNSAFGFYQDGTDPNLWTGDSAFGTGMSKGAVVGTIAIANAANATPNPQGAEVYRYSVNGATATINNPINVKEGRAFTLEILNNSGGATAITLGAAFLGTFPAPGVGKWRTQRYIFDNTLAKWKPTGAQSGDL